MQKFFGYILAIVLLILPVSGCAESGENPVAQIPEKFESDFSADYGRLKLNGHISKLETGIYEITITSPESIRGLKFSYLGGKISADFGGIGFKAECGNLLPSGFIAEISNLLDTAGKANLTSVTKTDGYNKICALSQGDNSYILQEQSSGSIVSLTIENADISMNFIDFKSY